MITMVRVGSVPAPSAIVSRSAAGRELGDAPAPDHRDDGADRQRAGAAARAAAESAPAPRARRAPRAITSGSAVAGEAVVDVAGVVAEDEDPRERDRAGDQRRGQGAGREVALEVLVAGVAGVA